MIISASRRTDIPAFYSEWFMNRVEAGFVLVRNPFNAHQVKRVSLLTEDVTAFVFWTRNSDNLFNHLSTLDRKGYNYYFQYTITGYSRELEKAVPKTMRAIESFIQLSNTIGKEKVVWRYDPILLSNVLGIDEHKRLFSKIAKLLAGKTETIFISFADFYKKTVSNLNKVEGLVYSDITQEKELLLDLSLYMAKEAYKNGMTIQSCSETIDLSNIGIVNGKCIDEQLIKRVFGLSVSGTKDSNQRDGCGCVKSVDIGSYNTCLHECAYCYATFNKKMAVNNKRLHNPNSPFLVGELDENATQLLVQESVQNRLFE